VSLNRAANAPILASVTWNAWAPQSGSKGRQNVQNLTESTTRRQRGFTLVELLVVITILGILAAVVVFAVGGVGDKGQSKACKTDAQTIRTAVEAYRANNSATATPAMGADLVPNYLQKASTLWTLSYTGTTVTLTPIGSTCSASDA
jgi:prepilin-type N-terminal cleavage/methylation domain-containing protein